MEQKPDRPSKMVHNQWTPWGWAQTSTDYGRGLTFYSTVSHGGFKVSAKLLERIPEYMQTADRYADGTKGWFEEDAAWSLVAVCLPEFFTVEERKLAFQTANSYYRNAIDRYINR